MNITKSFLNVLWASLFFSVLCYGQTIRISEIMADNGGTLLDEDGSSPDWIELYNTSEAPVDLSGWYLTDDSADLTQWKFPATLLPAKGFLIVFASGKNRAVSGAELHTNFKVSAAGEYIALVQADGRSVEDEFSVPALEKDTSFGYAFFGAGGTGEVLLDQGALCFAHVPSGPNDAAGWKLQSFDYSGWQSGVTGIGFDSAPDYLPYIGLNVQTVMKGINATIYIRVPFSLTDAAGVTSLLLKMKYEDAFVAYLNGTPVAESALAPASLAWNSSATSFVNPESQATTFQDFDLTAFRSALVEGDNVLAIHGMNSGTGSSDLLMMPKLEATLAEDYEIDTSTLGILTAPTPGVPNTEISYAGYIETPVVTPGRGFYSSSVQVAVSNLTAGATVRYTLDGSEPTESSPVFPSSLSISSTKNLRVKAFKTDWKPSYPRTDTYIFANDVVSVPRQSSSISGTSPSSLDQNGAQVITIGMDSGVLNKTYQDSSNQVFTVEDALKAIPSVSITTDDDNLFDPASGIYVNAGELGVNWERPASMELIYPDGVEGFHINAGIRIRGASSRSESNPKHSFRVYFRNEYGAGKLNYPLFEDEGVKSFDKIDLRTAQNRKWAGRYGHVKNSFLRDIFGRDSSRDMGTGYARSRYYHLYVNGLYYGLYMTEERPTAAFAASYYGGDKDDYDAVKCVSNWDAEKEGRTIEATDGNLNAYSNLYVSAMAGFSDNADYFRVQGMDANGQPDPSLTKWVDLDNMIDYLLFIHFADGADNGLSPWGNPSQGVDVNARLNNLFGVYNRANPDGFKWFQHDLEWSMDSVFSDGNDFIPGTADDNFTYGDHRDRTGPFNHSNFDLFKYFNPQTLHDRMMVNAEYRLAFADRLSKHLEGDGALTYSNCLARIELRQAQIDRAIVANAARWGSTSLDRDTWLTAVSQMKAWVSARKPDLIALYEADGLIPSVSRPQLSLSGGLVDDGTLVSITASHGTIYYTTDGTDPRAIGGVVSGEVYSGPIAIHKPTHLKARVRNGSVWSALSEGTFWTSEIPLAVTELMYHAPDGNPHDYIEIKNVSDETVTLKGYKLDNAVDFKFKNGPVSLAAGQFMVLVDDMDAFASSYPTNGIIIGGEFSGDFSNSGEKVDLEFRNNDLISFSYSDARNWPQAANGAGHSLVPLEEAVDGEEKGSLSYGGNWRASTYMDGSPGYAEPVEAPTVVINEVTAHTDTSLAESFDSNDRIELYNPTAQPIALDGWHLSDDLDNLTKFAIPDGTVVPPFGFVVFDEDDFHPERSDGFGLDKAGEQVVLSAPGRVVDAIRFKGQENGVSLGRYPDGTANWVTTVVTPESPNQPVTAYLRISELMYNSYPNPESMEYIQLENAGTAAAQFYNPIGAYRIDGGVSFSFPAGTSLAAGQKLWLVSFDPALETTLLSQFRSLYGLSGSDTVYGPYKGELSNRGERVALERPQDSDDPLKPLDLSWVVVDELFYFDQAPWPDGADGTGFPLVRTGLSSWGAPSATDTDADVMPDSWELAYFGSLEQAEPDTDFDGQSNVEEYIADTNPTNSASLFVVEDLSVNTLFWTPSAGRSYSVFWTDDLASPFTRIASGLTSGSYTDTLHGDGAEHYYRITVEISPAQP